MEGVFMVLAVVFAGIALWGARGMLQVYRKREEFDAEGEIKAGQGRAAG